MNKWPQSYSELLSLPSHCQSKQRSIVSEEKGLKHIALNVDNNKVSKTSSQKELFGRRNLIITKRNILYSNARFFQAHRACSFLRNEQGSILLAKR